MSLPALLASKRIERHLTSSNELTGLRKLIARDMADAGVPGLSPDRTFATAYNAVLQLSKLALACAGYRVSASVPGHHQATFEAPVSWAPWFAHSLHFEPLLALL